MAGLPVSAGANSVEIDAAALAAEAQAVPLPDDPATAGAAQAEDGKGLAQAAELKAVEASARAQWLPTAQFAVHALATVATGWKLLPDECDMLAMDVAMCAAVWCPDGVIPTKYLVLATLGGHAFALAMSRRDPQTGKFPPLRAVPASAQTAASAVPAATGGGVSTSA